MRLEGIEREGTMGAAARKLHVSRTAAVAGAEGALSPGRQT